MFSKGSKEAGQQVVPAGANKNHSPSIIGPNLKITGNLVTDGVIQLDGVVDGDVKSDDLTLGESAVINGSIESKRVRVAGTVNGQITGGVVELTRTAKVTGDINHASLMIEAGAYVQGLCRHVEQNAIKATPKLTDQAKPVVSEKPQQQQAAAAAAVDDKAEAAPKKATG
jgi:cytoskeletal protein CcmA (bactofilin family)